MIPCIIRHPSPSRCPARQVRQTQRAKVQQQRLELKHGAEKANGKEREASSLQAKVRQLEERLEIGSQADLETRLARMRQENVELKADYRAAEEDVSGSSLREDLANHRNQKRTVRPKALTGLGWPRWWPRRTPLAHFIEWLADGL